MLKEIKYILIVVLCYLAFGYLIGQAIDREIVFENNIYKQEVIR